MANSECKSVMTSLAIFTLEWYTDGSTDGQNGYNAYNYNIYRTTRTQRVLHSIVHITAAVTLYIVNS